MKVIAALAFLALVSAELQPIRLPDPPKPEVHEFVLESVKMADSPVPEATLDTVKIAEIPIEEQYQIADIDIGHLIVPENVMRQVREAWRLAEAQLLEYPDAVKVAEIAEVSAISEEEEFAYAVKVAENAELPETVKVAIPKDAVKVAEIANNEDTFDSVKIVDRIEEAIKSVPIEYLRDTKPWMR